MIPVSDAGTTPPPGHSGGIGSTVPLMTVRELLELEVIQRAGPTFHGSQTALDRPVRWVHTGEIADIAEFLSGGEAVLTGGLGFGSTNAEQRRYVRSLASAGVAVLVVETAGRVFTKLPSAVLEEAAQADLPIIATMAEFPFVAVTAQVHRRIVNSRFDVLEAVERVGREFGELLTRDIDPQGLIDHLAQVARCPVLLETAAGQMRAYAGGTAMTDRLVMHWDRHWAADHHDEATSARQARSAIVDYVGEPADTPAARCLLHAVVLRGQPWGYLHVLTAPDSPTVTPYLAERAATFVAIALLNQRVVRARRMARTTVLLSRLRNGDINAMQFIRDALTMGIDLRDRPLAVLAIDTSGVAPSVPADRGDGSPPESDLLSARLTRAGLPVLSSEEPGIDLLVVGLPDPKSVAIVRREAESTGMSCGLSELIPDAYGVVAATEQARQAMVVASSMNPGAVVDADKLGLFALLVDMVDRPALRGFVERELGPLLAEHAAADHLLGTLRAYAGSGFNKAEAAKALHVQRRTLYYRLQRITERLGVDLDAPEAQTRLSVALAALDLLGARAGAAARTHPARGGERRSRPRDHPAP